MMRTLMGASFVALCLSSAPAFADGKIYVQLPDLSEIGGAAAETLLMQVVLANVVSSNCAGFEVTDEEWSLLTDSADILARANLGYSVDDYDEFFYKPAFAALDKPETCAEEGPNVQPIIDQLVALGGSREALPDQDKAYEEWRAMQDAWDAGTTAPVGVGKTKTK